MKAASTPTGKLPSSPPSEPDILAMMEASGFTEADAPFLMSMFDPMPTDEEMLSMEIEETRSGLR
jgi:hypothetical protein